MGHGASGGVGWRPGVGKSYLMDLMYEHVDYPSKKRIHFHSFMMDVHSRLHEHRKACAWLVMKLAEG